MDDPRDPTGGTTDAALLALAPPGTADPAAWLADLALTVSTGESGDARIGAVQVTEAVLTDAKLALADWTQGLAADDPARVALARGFAFWLLRPALRLTRVAAGTQVARPATPVWGDWEAAIRAAVATTAPSVGRIDLVTAAGERVAYGTAWVVGEREDRWVLLTARHVIDQLRAGGWKPGGLTAVLDFDALDAPGPGLPVAPGAWTHSALDLARIELPRALAPELSPIVLGGAAVQPTDPVLVVGHGVYPPDPDGFAMRAVGFDDAPGVKRASPGWLRPVDGPGLQPPPTRWAGALPHDATTLGGNSGGPVIDLRSREALGMHVGGQGTKSGWFVTNFALPTTQEALATLLAGVTLPQRGPLWT